jgi:hypothetical protein
MFSAKSLFDWQLIELTFDAPPSPSGSTCVIESGRIRVSRESLQALAALPLLYISPNCELLPNPYFIAGRPSSAGRGDYSSSGRGGSPLRRGESSIYRGGRFATSTRGGAVYNGAARGEAGGRGFASYQGQPRGRGASNGFKRQRGGGVRGD